MCDRKEFELIGLFIGDVWEFFLKDLKEMFILKLRSDISGLGQVTERSSI